MKGNIIILPYKNLASKIISYIHIQQEYELKRGAFLLFL
jgi:hypothetical protein